MCLGKFFVGDLPVTAACFTWRALRVRRVLVVVVVASLIIVAHVALSIGSAETSAMTYSESVG